MTKREIIKSMHLRRDFSKALEEVRFGNTEIIIMHYQKPVAKLIKLTDEEKAQIIVDAESEV